MKWFTTQRRSVSANRATDLEPQLIKIRPLTNNSDQALEHQDDSLKNATKSDNAENDTSNRVDTKEQQQQQIPSNAGKSKRLLCDLVAIFTDEKLDFYTAAELLRMIGLKF
jgi:hypothetical protein